MLRRWLKRRLAGVHTERGFTLVEVMVAVLGGTVVMAALFTMLDVTLHQTSRTYSRVSATQRARVVFEQIQNELHSACVTTNAIPIQGGGSGSQDSSSTTLAFVTYYGTAANPTPTEHVISLSNGSLIEQTYTVTGSDPTVWTFGTTPTQTTTLLANAALSGGTPLFQYFAYEPYTDSSGNTDMMLMDGTTAVPGTTTLPNPDPLPASTGLSAADAQSAAEVQITLRVGPDVKAGESGTGLNSNLTDAWTTVTDSVVLRFETTPNQAGSNATFGPCS